MELLLDYLSSIHPMSAALRQHFLEVLEQKHIPKRTFLLKAGKVCKEIAFINTGLVRCFYEWNQKDVSSWFMKEGDLIISVESFYRQKESYENIQALEDCVVLTLSHSQLQHIYDNYPEANFIGRMLTEQYYVLSEQRSFNLRRQTARERYKYVQINQPELILRVSNKHLASYLGISEETLSRIRGEK